MERQQRLFRSISTHSLVQIKSSELLTHLLSSPMHTTAWRSLHSQVNEVLLCLENWRCRRVLMIIPELVVKDGTVVCTGPDFFSTCIIFSLLERKESKDIGIKRCCSALQALVSSKGMCHWDLGVRHRHQTLGNLFDWDLLVSAVSIENVLCLEVLSLFYPSNHTLIQVMFTGFVLLCSMNPLVGQKDLKMTCQYVPLFEFQHPAFFTPEYDAMRDTLTDFRTAVKKSHSDYFNLTD